MYFIQFSGSGNGLKNKSDEPDFLVSKMASNGWRAGFSDSLGGILVHRGTRDNKDIDVYCCQDCGTRFLSRMSQKCDYENGFMYKSSQLSVLDFEQRLELFRRDDMRRYERVKELCSGKKVLDFGCGFGGFLKYISKVASSCCGVDLGEDERNFLNERGIKCFRTIEESGEVNDVITLFHTFEHLPEPRMWLNKFSNYLVPGGYLVIEVPHAGDILLSLYENRKFADFTYWSAHLFLYSMKGLSMVIDETGKYSIQSMEQIQRYTIANHLLWLAKGLPNGHNKWDYLDSAELNEAYKRKLQEMQMCDTLFFILRKK